MAYTLYFGLSSVLLPSASRAQDNIPPANPFQGFETRILDNGLKVWFKNLPDARAVSISVALPIGRDSDPVGKEQLAHFTEHMLFADHGGRSEEEIKKEIEDLGGEFNASVSDTRTFFFVRVDKEYGLFALEWLYRVISPHAMEPEVVERQRAPVALEIGARPRQLFEWVWAYYIDRPSLRVPGFWEKEFGIETLRSRDYYPYASLNRIGPEDLRWFYDTYYVPSLMTVTIVGALDAAAVASTIDETFAQLSQRPEPPLSASLTDPGRYRQSNFWTYRSDVFYRSRFKFYGLSAADNVLLIFVSQFLGKRLNDRLRFGDEKATYGLRSRIVRRGEAAILEISGGLEVESFQSSKRVIEEELEGLRTGSLDRTRFEEDRSAVTLQLQRSGYSPIALETWVRTSFHDSRLHHDFPDLVTIFDTLSAERVEAFASRALVPERQVVTVVYPQPLTQGVVVIVLAVLVSLTVSLTRRRLISPVEMTRIRYVARFHIPILLFGAMVGVLVILVGGGGRLLVFGFQRFSVAALWPIENFFLQWSTYGLMLMMSIILLLLLLSRIPRKVLLFEDHVRIKYLSYRSVQIPAEEVEEVELRSFREVWLSSAVWRLTPLTFGVFAPGIYLKRRNGRGYFFDVRNRDELLDLLRRLTGDSGSKQRSPETTPPAPPPESDPTA